MRRDDDGDIVILFIGLAIVIFIVYMVCLLAMAVAGIAAAGGTIFGGGTAIRNYFQSFKENIIDDNRKIATI